MKAQLNKQWKIALAVLFAAWLLQPALAGEDDVKPEDEKEQKARGAAMLDTFAAEFMPKTHARYKQISEKFALTSKTLADLETSIRENGGDPANDETYKVIYERGKTLSLQIYRIRDTLFGNYCYRKMEVFTSEELLKRDNEFAAWFDAEYLTKKAVAPKGE